MKPTGQPAGHAHGEGACGFGTVASASTSGGQRPTPPTATRDGEKVINWVPVSS